MDALKSKNKTDSAARFELWTVLVNVPSIERVNQTETDFHNKETHAFHPPVTFRPVCY